MAERQPLLKAWAHSQAELEYRPGSPPFTWPVISSTHLGCADSSQTHMFAQQAARGGSLGEGLGFLSTLDSHNLLSGSDYLRMFTKLFLKAKEVN